MNDTGHELIGSVDGAAIFASSSLIATLGRERVRYELVDKELFRRGIVPAGYHRIRTRISSDDCVLIKADSHEAALKKYLSRKKP